MLPELHEMSLQDHLHDAHTLLCKCCKANQRFLIDDEDCISYIATAMMQAYDSYKPDKGAQIQTWVTLKGKYAITDFCKNYRRSFEPAHRRLDDGSKRLTNLDWLDNIKEDRHNESNVDMETIVAIVKELLEYHLLTSMVRMYMELHYICGWTGKEIARMLDVNVRNVHAQIITGRKRLIEFAITNEMKERFENCYRS